MTARVRPHSLSAPQLRQLKLLQSGPKSPEDKGVHSRSMQALERLGLVKFTEGRRLWSLADYRPCPHCNGSGQLLLTVVK